MPRVLFAFLLIISATAHAGVHFSITFDSSIRAEPATGRLVVYLIGPQATRVTHSEPADGPFLWDPQPLYGMFVTQLAPGTPAIIDDSATSYPMKPSELPPGTYRAQAVLDLHRDASSWKFEPGNLFSDSTTFELTANDTAVALTLSHVVQSRPPTTMPGVEMVELRSEKLSKFRGHEVRLRAGVVLPTDYDPQRAYPAVYGIPGFSTDHYAAVGVAEARDREPPESALRELHRNAFWIVPDCAGPNGDTLLANSEVNGPCADAFIEELIPAIEAKYNLIRSPGARVLRGHSSGGWAAIWLAVNYPQVFSGAWAMSPDPLDFHRLERVDIYARESAYVIDGHPTPSFRIRSGDVLTVRDENGMEEVLGPGNSSAQQWDSWQAVFGHRDELGNPKSLFDAASGKIDKREADFWKRKDVTELVRNDPSRFVPLFNERIRIIVGDQDNFFLDESVGFLRSTLANVGVTTPADRHFGYIKIVPGVEHGGIVRCNEAGQFPREMLDHFRRTRVIP